MEQTVSRVLAGALLVVVMAAVLSAAGRAARDTDSMPSASSRELVVFEANNCIYCSVFRRDVLPNYLASQRAADLPIRFVNISENETAEKSLNSPLTLVPTVVYMEDGLEVTRIAGYTGPENFFRILSQTLGR
jgi:thioredoxin-related protein